MTEQEMVMKLKIFIEEVEWITRTYLGSTPPHPVTVTRIGISFGYFLVGDSNLNLYLSHCYWVGGRYKTSLCLLVDGCPWNHCNWPGRCLGLSMPQLWYATVRAFMGCTAARRSPKNLFQDKFNYFQFSNFLIKLSISMSTDSFQVSLAGACKEVFRPCCEDLEADVATLQTLCTSHSTGSCASILPSLDCFVILLIAFINIYI